MPERCAPGPINSCTIVWSIQGEGPNARIVGSCRTHPTGGLTENCEGTQGLALNLLGNPDTIDPPSGLTDAGIRISTANEIYIPPPTRKRYEFPASVEPSVTTGATLLARSVPIDASTFTEDSCWELCVDICEAFIDTPTGTSASVTIPPGGEITVPDTGGTFSHSHGTINVTPAPASAAQLKLTIGDTTCGFLSADKTFGIYSGRQCGTITAPAGVVTDVPIEVEVSTASVSSGFTASSGSLTVFVQRVECSEAC